MTSTLRGTMAAIFAVSAIVLASCSSGVHVPAIGFSTPTKAPTTTPTPSSTASGATATPTGGATSTPTGAATATPTGGATATPTGGATATPTGGATATPTGAATPTPTGAPTATPTGAPTATPTGAPTTAGCPPKYPSPQPISSMVAWPSAGGTIPLPAFADESGSIAVPVNNAPSGSILTITESQTPFTDSAGNGPIPTPAPGEGTAIVYSASELNNTGTVTLEGNETITVTASGPCEIMTGHTYVANVYINLGSTFDHAELTPTAGEPANFVAGSNPPAISFQVNLSNEFGEIPAGTYTEVVFIQHT
jgi:hypothetical protein